VKAGVGGYFRDPVAFEQSGGKGILPGGDTVNPPKPEMAPDEQGAERQRLELTVLHIREGLEQEPAFRTLKDQVEFTVSPEGLRIDLVEKDDSSFFDSGSAVLRGESEHVLGLIATELGSLSHKVDIEGHTDSRRYASSDRYSNWELSADRANAARRVMERNGLRNDQVASVRGLADRQLRFPKLPLDARNRRVTILVTSPLLAKEAKPTEPAAAATPDTHEATGVQATPPAHAPESADTKPPAH
jgi:chemotaxis protein MotB